MAKAEATVEGAGRHDRAMPEVHFVKRRRAYWLAPFVAFLLKGWFSKPADSLGHGLVGNVEATCDCGVRQVKLSEAQNLSAE